MKKEISENQMEIIAHIETDFPSKFGIPRQSGLVPALKGRIVFEPKYRNPDYVRGLEEFSHIWILWKFSESKKDHVTATVRPPRLGGKQRIGVFASRSPFRPNDIGLSCVKLERVFIDPEEGASLFVSGVDLMNGTPIYDIKPYIPIADCHPDASEGYTKDTKLHRLEVVFPEKLLEILPEAKREAAFGILSEDPRPKYVPYADRRYGIAFAGFDIRFTVENDVLTVCEVVVLPKY